MKITATFDTESKELTVTKDGASVEGVTDVCFYNSKYGPSYMSMYQKLDDGVYVNTSASLKNIEKISKLLGF